MFSHYLHEVITTPKGNIVLIDVANTPDCGWEGAYSFFNEEKFREALHDWFKDDEYTFEDICEYGEEADAFDRWEVVSSHHRKPETAERYLMKAIKSM